MNRSTSLPTIEALKDQAKRLRSTLGNREHTISHSQALELLAHQHGYKDWNTLHAAIGNTPPPPPVTLGQIVTGEYLRQPFIGEVISVQKLGQGERYRVTLNFDEPVDVVSFDSFSSFRQRVSCTIQSNGMTWEKTSDGSPQMKIAI